MKKISVVGWSGMLGKRVVDEALKRGFLVEPYMGRLGGDKFNKMYFSGIDIIINCAGSIPLKRDKWVPMVEANTIGPWQLAAAANEYGCRLIHMSTDCVFSGKRAIQLFSPGNPDPEDLYARSKLAGEPIGENVLVVRGSFVGPDHGFVFWLREEHEEIELWRRAIWNGGSVWAMARVLLDLANQELTGVIHVGAEKEVSKAWMGGYILNKLRISTTATYTDIPSIWRKLEPDVLLPPVQESLEELLEEMKHDC